MNKESCAASLAFLLVAGIFLGAITFVGMKVSAAWSISTVDSAGLVGSDTAIALDSNQFPHISYRDISNSDLKYAKWTGSAWSLETVDSAGSVGRYTSIALDSSGYPHISYIDSTNGNLKYAKWTGSAWSIATVDNAGNVGAYSSIALDSGGYAHISYHQYAPDFNLKYAKWTGSAWSLQVVDSTGTVGEDTSITLDSNGYPWISYLDYTNYDLKLARWTGSAWSLETVDSTGYVGEHTSIKLDSSGYPHISYYDYSPNYDLKYAAWTGSAWSIETVDSAGTVGEHASLGLDASGYPHVSYYDATNGNLKYARWTGSIWSIEAVDTVGDIGGDTGLALDSSGYAHISYHDYTNYDLKYASWSGGPPNNPPNTPSVPSGPTSGIVATSYSYSTSATDPDGDNVKYVFDWGDGNTSQTGFVPSGTPASLSHAWSLKGTYQVRTRAADVPGATSGWSGFLSVTIMATPSAPLSLGATSGDAQVTLAWSAPADNGGSPITNYTIYSGTTSGGETFLVKIGNVLTYLDTGLTNGVTYFYKVSATNAAGEGAQSNEASATPSGIFPPTAPMNLVATAGDQSVTLTWLAPLDDGGSPIVNYTVYRGTTPAGEGFLEKIGNVLTHLDTGLTNGVTYFYMVAAVNAAGQGPNSTEASAIPKGAPTAPPVLQATPGDGQISLTWNAPASDGGSPITNYEIYRGLATNTETFLVEVGNVLAHLDTGLTNGQTYFYKVSAKNAIGEGPLSNEASATPVASTQPPMQPLGLAAMSGAGNVTLTWSTPASDGGSPITNYRVFRGTVSGGEVFLVEIGNLLTYLDTGVIGGQTYYYEVTAKNAIGEGPRSNEASATPFMVPTPPRNLQAAPGNTQIFLDWVAPPSDGGSLITNYRIYRGTTIGGESFLVEIGNVLAYTDTGLTNGQIYFYKASAKNAAGEGPMSNEASATPTATPNPPTQPRNLQATPSDGQVALTWTAPLSDGGSPITNHRIYRGTTSGGEAFLIEIGNVLTYTNTGLANGQTYYYQITARNAVGEGARSNEANATPATVPGRPRAPHATAGISQVVLDWNSPVSDGGSPVIHYEVYRGIASGGETFLVEIGDVLTYQDTSVTNGVTYYYEVSAKNAVGEGPRSNEVSATPSGSALPPSAPQNLTATAGDANVTLAWLPPLSNGGSPVTNYRIYRGTSSGGEIFFVEMGNLLTYLDTSVINEVTYYYNVSARNAIGEGPMSNEASAIPSAPIHAPSAPQNLAAAASDRSVTLTWLPPLSDGGSPVTNYRIYRGTSSGGETFRAEIGNILMYLDTGLTSGIRYYYTVAAVNAVGEGPNSTEASATPLATPTAPLNLQSAPANALVVLTWSAPTSDGGLPVTNYEVYRGPATNAETFLAEVGNILTFDDVAVVNGQTYFYKVSAKNAVGEGPASNEASATPSASIGPPSAPQNPAATGGNGMVSLTWEPPLSDGGSPITNYRVHRGTVPRSGILLVELGIVLAYVDSAVTNGTTYYYTISAKNVAGEGSNSVEVNATPIGPHPVNQPPLCAITTPTAGATIFGTYSVNGTASDPDGTVSYVEVSIDGDGWTQAIGTALWSLQLNTTRLTDGQHTIRARSFDGTNYSAEATINVTVHNAGTLPPGGTSILGEAWFWAVLVFAVLLTMLLLLVFLKKRKHKEEGQSEETEAVPPRIEPKSEEEAAVESLSEMEKLLK